MGKYHGQGLSKFQAVPQEGSPCPLSVHYSDTRKRRIHMVQPFSCIPSVLQKAHQRSEAVCGISAQEERS